MKDIHLLIDVRNGEDSDLRTVLSTHGVLTKPQYVVQTGQQDVVFEGPMPGAREILHQSPSYIMATASAEVLNTALKAYADSKKKRLMICYFKSGIKVDATNNVADKLKEITFIDIAKFED